MQLAKSAECGMFISETKVQQMPAATCVQLHPGDVIRTMDLRKRYGAKNPSRVVKRLVSEGRLRPIERGLYAVPQPSKFGDVPPQDDTLIRKFLNTSDFIFTGPDRWNALGLGSTAVFPMRLVYNRKRHGDVELDNRRFRLRQCTRLPTKPSAEWFAIDLIENASSVGLDLETLEERLRAAVRQGSFDPVALRRVAGQYGTKPTRELVDRCCSPGER